MKLLLTGSGGLLGSALNAAWQTNGHACFRLVRGDADDTAINWDPAADAIPNHERLEGMEAVVHLAGRNIACRWTPANRAAIRDSRIRGTALLARTLAGLKQPPAVFLSASATGYYGDTGNRDVDETAGMGTGFLAEVCRDWEAATAPATQAGIRVVHLRTGAVLSRQGGMLGKILPLFQAGFGGRIGSGKQFLSWISLPDVVSIIRFLIKTDAIRGPVNLVSPTPITNAEFTRILAHALSRPAVFSVPAFAARLMLGQMAEETALLSTRVKPDVLLRHGYRFAHPDLAGALQAVLSSP